MSLRSKALLSLLPNLVLVLGSCSNSGGSSANATITFNPQIYIGNWSGTWTNTTTSATDTVTIMVEQDGTDLMIEFDMNGEVFGVTDPDAETFTARILPNEARLVSTRSSVYGTLIGSVSGEATIMVTGTGNSGAIDRFVLTGTTNGTQMTANVTITFDSGAIENANAILFKT